MDKNEFLDILRSQLSGQMPEGQINTHIQYYRNYIEERMQSDNSESEVMRELGDPRLIARTLLDTETGRMHRIRTQVLLMDRNPAVSV